MKNKYDTDRKHLKEKADGKTKEMEQYLEDEYENWLSKVNKGKGIIGPDN